MKSALLTMDDLDSRREVHVLLHRLSPAKRVAFLDWCCQTCGGVRPKMREWLDGAWVPTAFAKRVDAAVRSDRDDDCLTNEIFHDFWILVCQWGLDGERAAKVLERYVRTGQLPPSSPSCTPRPASPRTSYTPASG